MCQCNELRKAFEPLDKLGLRKLSSVGGCSPYERRNTNAQLKKLAALMWRDQSRRESRLMKCRPEPVSRAREMTRDCCGIQSRIDPAEEHVEAGRNQIGKA